MLVGVKGGGGEYGPSDEVDGGGYGGGDEGLHCGFTDSGGRPDCGVLEDFEAVL